MEGAIVRKTTLFLFHMKRFRVWTPGEVNILYCLRYLLIEYYIHYNKLEFDAPGIHDVTLKIYLVCPHGEAACYCTASAWICTLDTPTQPWENIVCKICIAVISQAQYLIDSWRSLYKKKYSICGASNRTCSSAHN